MSLGDIHIDDEISNKHRIEKIKFDIMIQLLSSFSKYIMKD